MKCNIIVLSLFVTCIAAFPNPSQVEIPTQLVQEPKEIAKEVVEDNKESASEVKKVVVDPVETALVDTKEAETPRNKRHLVYGNVAQVYHPVQSMILNLDNI